jgi:hypothetical protein
MVLSDLENNLPLEYLLEKPSWVPQWREGIIDPILPDKDALLQPFRQLRLGFEIDDSFLRRSGKRFFKLTEFGLKMKVIREKGLKEAEGG